MAHETRIVVFLDANFQSNACYHLNIILLLACIYFDDWSHTVWPAGAAQIIPNGISSNTFNSLARFAFIPAPKVMSLPVSHRNSTPTVLYAAIFPLYSIILIWPQRPTQCSFVTPFTYSAEKTITRMIAEKTFNLIPNRTASSWPCGNSNNFRQIWYWPLHWIHYIEYVAVGRWHRCRSIINFAESTSSSRPGHDATCGKTIARNVFRFRNKASSLFVSNFTCNQLRLFTLMLRR